MDIKNRKEIDKKYKWNLDSLYSNLEDFRSDYRKVDELSVKLKDYKGKILEDADNLKTVIDKELKINRILENLYAYSKMKSDEDTRNTDNQALVSRCESLSVRVKDRLSFIVPEILKGDKDLILNYINENEDLNLYEHYLHDILRQKEHVLSEPEEKIIAQAGEVLSGPENIFTMLNNADFEFPMIKDEDGNEFKLSHGNFIKTLESRDRKVRENAFKEFYGVFDKHKNSLASILSTQIKKDVFISKVRKYENSLESSLSDNNIPTSVYENLINSVHENIGSLHKYMKLRKRLLNVDKLHMYDLYAPIIDDVDFDIKYEEAKEIIIDSLNIMGNEYVDIVEDAFEDNWIDVYENKGKKSGAYSFGTYDSKPYILMNYNDNLNSLYTLIHEMGHSMHSYLTRNNQPYVYGNYSIFVAEVASTTNEALLNEYLLENLDDRKKRMYVLNYYLEQFRTTLFRQVMFAEFEKYIHEQVENNNPLTVDVLMKKYKELNEFYYGEDVICDEEIAMEWARIPHFYYNYYVFQYATGFSAAIAFKNKIVNDGESAVKNYLKFLSSGSKDYPIEILKEAGIDMTKEKPVNSALTLFDNLVDEMENMTKL